MSLKLMISPPIPSFSSNSSFYSTTSNISHLERAQIHISPPKKRLNLCCSKKDDSTSFTDRILDYIEGGPKLRKWYGASERRPKDGGAQEDESDDIEETRDAVLVTEGESEMVQMVILSLIVKRARIKALVKDKRAALEAFGTYVEPIVGDISDKVFLKNSMRGVRAIICTTHGGFLSKEIDMKGVEHIILLSQLAVYRDMSGFQALINGNLKKMAEKDEEILISCGVPYTIIRTGSLQNTPGGIQGFSFKEGVAAKGLISKEDAATICVEALDVVPSKGFIFEVANGEEKISDWKAWFEEQLNIEQ
ncbi:hypothetical protein LUZ60_007241 [Juncus effusus]|nr:hypothetical protein LUZ60_007241 [Juncus effusus]